MTLRNVAACSIVFAVACGDAGAEGRTAGNTRSAGTEAVPAPASDRAEGLLGDRERSTPGLIMTADDGWRAAGSATYMVREAHPRVAAASVLSLTAGVNDDYITLELKPTIGRSVRGEHRIVDATSGRNPGSHAYARLSSTDYGSLQGTVTISSLAVDRIEGTFSVTFVALTDASRTRTVNGTFAGELAASCARLAEGAPGEDEAAPEWVPDAEQRSVECRAALDDLRSH